jgi:hypothetical protein
MEKRERQKEHERAKLEEKRKAEIVYMGRVAH